MSKVSVVDTIIRRLKATLSNPVKREEIRKELLTKYEERQKEDNASRKRVLKKVINGKTRY